MVQWIKYPVLELWFTSQLFWFLSSSLLMHSGRQQKAAQVLSLHVGDPDGVLSFWLHPVPDLVIMAIWAVNQQKTDSLSLSLCLTNI